MFKHIYDACKRLYQRALKPPTVKHPNVLQLQGIKSPFTPPSNRRFAKAHRAKLAAQLLAINDQGKGYAQVPVAAPKGYFWKLDEGALDGVGSRRWRLYKEPARGY